MSLQNHDQATAFRAMHQGAELLVLPNAWDAASAVAIERAGAKAIATTSAGIAQSLGYPDGNVLTRELAVAAVARITRVVQVPVSADIEEGYGETPEEVCRTVEQILEAGAVGINLEDGSKPPALLAAKIAAIRKRAEQLGASLFINARTDVYLLGVEKQPLDETLKRAALYREAGADGLFVPRLKDPDSIRRVCAEAGLPVNLLGVPGIASPRELSALGVRRLSVGHWIAKAATSFTERCARVLLAEGRYDDFIPAPAS
jgi:2-methylisocitrate lyase-like PEP mutase family enzyme